MRRNGANIPFLRFFFLLDNLILVICILDYYHCYCYYQVTFSTEFTRKVTLVFQLFLLLHFCLLVCRRWVCLFVPDGWVVYLSQMGLSFFCCPKWQFFFVPDGCLFVFPDGFLFLFVKDGCLFVPDRVVCFIFQGDFLFVCPRWVCLFVPDGFVCLSQMGWLRLFAKCTAARLGNVRAPRWLFVFPRWVVCLFACPRCETFCEMHSCPPGKCESHKMVICFSQMGCLFVCLSQM